MKNPFRKLNEDGFDHVFLAFFVVVIVAIIGTYLVVSSRAATAYSTIVNVNGKCLNNAHALKAQDNPVEEYHCLTPDNGGAQKWVQKGTTIVNYNGYCLTAKSRLVSAPVVIQQCDGHELQNWTVDASAKRIVNVPSGLCLDIPKNLQADKTLMEVYTCNGTNAQLWSFTTSTTTSSATISSFTANPTTVASGGTTTLSWTQSGASSCSVTPGGPTNTTATSWKSGALTASTTFTLTCGSATKTAAVTVSGATSGGSNSAEKFGYSAASSQWSTKLANIGGGTHIKYRRIYYQSFTDSLNLVKEAEADGMTPVISYKTGKWSWSQVASGAADADLRTLINNLNAVSGPKVVVIHHEPAKDGTDTDWANMQLHALPMIKSGATNVSVGVIGNGWWWTSGPNHLSDAAIARYIPASLISKIDFVGADTYQDIGSTEDPGVKVKNMVSWAGRVGGVKGIGIGEWNATSGATITDSMNVMKSQPLLKWACMWDNGAAGTIGAPLSGDRLTAFKAGLATTNPT